MAIKRISDNQIADTTNAILTTLSFLNQTSVFRLPSGTQANRPTGVSVGTQDLILILTLLKSIRQMMVLVMLVGLKLLVVVLL